MIRYVEMQQVWTRLQNITYNPGNIPVTTRLFINRDQDLLACIVSCRMVLTVRTKRINGLVRFAPTAPPCDGCWLVLGEVMGGAAVVGFDTKEVCRG